MDAAARVGGRRAQVEPRDPGLGPAEAGDRPEDQLLVQLRGPPVDGAADQVGVALLQLAGSEHPAGDDAGAEAGREPLDPLLHPVGEALAVVAVPDAA